MKKLIATALAVIMTLSLSLTAFAAEVGQDTENKSVDTTITTSIEPTYTVTIPADVSVAFNALSTDFGAIELTAAQIDPDKCVRVMLVCDGTLNNKIDESKVIPYTVNSADGAFTSATYLAAGDKTELTINITQDDWNKAYAGEYTDTVTFEVSYVAK